MSSPDDVSVIDQQPPEWDPVFVHSRREAMIIASVWAVALLWAVPYCYFFGYSHTVNPEQIATIWGVPSWVFWGIAVPWLVADVFTIWFCFFYMQDDDLGEEQVSEHDQQRAASKNSAGGEGARS